MRKFFKRLVFRAYVVFVALTAPILLTFSYIFTEDYLADLREVYQTVWPAFKKGERLSS